MQDKNNCVIIKLGVKQMKVLIISMTCGEGHNFIAKAIKGKLDKVCEDVKIIDIYRSNELYKKLNNAAYLFMKRHMPRIYQYAWTKCKFRNSDKRFKGGVQKSIKPYIKDIQQEIVTYQPNVVICTHPNASAILTYLRRFDLVDSNIRMYSVLTDIFPCPFWESSIYIDGVFVPTKYGNEQMYQKGFQPDQLKYVGFPTAEKFSLKKDKKEIRRHLGLAEDMFTILLMSGGMGISSNLKLIKALQPAKVQIISISGRNTKTRNQIEKYLQATNMKRVHNLGFVTNIEDYMDAADAIASNMGGTSLGEAIQKQLPIIAREKLTINERENAEILQQEGIAVRLSKAKDIFHVVKELQAHPEKLEQMSQKCQKLAGTQALEYITQEVLHGTVYPYAHVWSEARPVTKVPKLAKKLKINIHA